MFYTVALTRCRRLAGLPLCIQEARGLPLNAQSRGSVRAARSMPTLKWLWHSKIMKNDDGAKEGMYRAHMHRENHQQHTATQKDLSFAHSTDCMSECQTSGSNCYLYSNDLQFLKKFLKPSLRVCAFAWCVTCILLPNLEMTTEQP